MSPAAWCTAVGVGVQGLLIVGIGIAEELLEALGVLGRRPDEAVEVAVADPRRRCPSIVRYGSAIAMRSCSRWASSLSERSRVMTPLWWPVKTSPCLLVNRSNASPDCRSWSRPRIGSFSSCTSRSIDAWLALLRRMRPSTRGVSRVGASESAGSAEGLAGAPLSALTSQLHFAANRLAHSW